MEKAQKTMQKAKQLKDKISSYESLKRNWEDMVTLVSLGIEMEDESVLEEVSEGYKALTMQIENMRLETLLSGAYDKNNAILTLHSGAGGTEAQDWVQMLFRMYTRWAERRGFRVETLDFLEGEEAGIKSVTFLVEGLNAYGYAKAEKGVHRLVRISPFDASGRRHTSFASVEVMPEIADDIEININPDDLRIDTYRSSGAGAACKQNGQRNPYHAYPYGDSCFMPNERSQHKNRETALKMLNQSFAACRAGAKGKIEDLKGVQKDIAWGVKSVRMFSPVQHGKGPSYRL